MVAPTIKTVAFDAVKEITPTRHTDSRGWFAETWSRPDLETANIDIDWMQDNESFSAPPGTLRGIHFQLPPRAQDKLVRVVSGSIVDVAVDLRRDSPTFRKYAAVTLTAEWGNQLLVPKGFGHAFCTLEANTHVAYKVSAPYAPDCDRSVRYDDPELGIEWPFGPSSLVLSPRDEGAPTLAELYGSGDLF